MYKEVHDVFWSLCLFFSMGYSHLHKCPRATQAQCISFIAKSACQEFWSKAPPQVHVLGGPHHYTE